MSEARDLFALLRQSADGHVVDAIERLVAEGEDHQLCRINALAFAARHGLDEEKVVAAFLHAARIGLFDMSWNVLCPGCGGVLDTNATLKTVQKEEYVCALCAAGYEPTLDEMVEVTFTVSPRVRRIAAHNPARTAAGRVSAPDLLGLRRRPARGRLRRDWSTTSCIEHVELAAGREGGAVAAAAGRVHHRLRAGDPFGAVHRRQGRADARAPEPLARLRPRAHATTRRWRCGPGRCASRSRTAPTRACCRRSSSPATRCTTCSAAPAPFLTAKRLLTNQTFRDLYRTDTLDVDQRLKITSLTFLFTDLRGSTELYERVGDLVAFDLVRAHFQVLHEIVAVGGRRGRQDDRRRGDGDVPDARPRGRRGAPHARGDARAQQRATAARTCCSRSACMRARASR